MGRNGDGTEYGERGIGKVQVIRRGIAEALVESITEGGSGLLLQDTMQ
jgi:hypothetical protein